jgi:hypothetical protein
LLGVPVGFYDGFDDAGFDKGAVFWHWGLLSQGRLQIIGNGLICQGKTLMLRAMVSPNHKVVEVEIYRWLKIQRLVLRFWDGPAAVAQRNRVKRPIPPPAEGYFRIVPVRFVSSHIFTILKLQKHRMLAVPAHQ